MPRRQPKLFVPLVLRGVAFQRCACTVASAEVPQAVVGRSPDPIAAKAKPKAAKHRKGQHDKAAVRGPKRGVALRSAGQSKEHSQGASTSGARPVGGKGGGGGRGLVLMCRPGPRRSRRTVKPGWRQQVWQLLPRFDTPIRA